MIDYIKQRWKQARCQHGVHLTVTARNGVIESKTTCPKCGALVPNLHNLNVSEQYQWFSKSKELGPDIVTVLREYNSEAPQNTPQTPYQILLKSEA